MAELRPFDLLPLGEGRFELRAFSDDNTDSIAIVLDPDPGRRLTVALGEAMTHVDTPEAEARDFEVAVGDRIITISALPASGLRLTVTRYAWQPMTS